MKLFFEFIGFMVFKTTGSISGLRIFFRFQKKQTLAKDISKKVKSEKDKIVNILGYGVFFSKPKENP